MAYTVITKETAIKMILNKLETEDADSIEQLLGYLEISINDLDYVVEGSVLAEKVGE